MSSKPSDEPDLETVRAKAIALLSRREHSRRELRRKLQQRQLPMDLIERALDELTASDLLSEARYAEVLIRSRVSRGFGPLRILAEAGEAGVDESLIRQALADEAVDWLAEARAAHEKRFGQLPANMDERARQTRFLTGRGFSAETVRRVLSDTGE